MAKLRKKRGFINFSEFFERAKSYAHLIIEGGLFEDSQELKKTEKRIVSVFLVDKRSHNIRRSTKDSVEITGVTGS